MKLVRSTREEWVAAGSAAATGLLLYAAFPPLEWTWAAWCALVPLQISARRMEEGRALRMGYLAGLLFWLLSIRWLTRVTVAGWIGLSGYCALYVLPTALFARRWRGGALGYAVGLAAVWCGGEFVRGWLGGGFPWNPLGAALTPWLPAVQLAEFGGPWLVSGLAAFANGLLAWALAERNGRRGLLAGALAVAGALGWGAWRAGELDKGDRMAREQADRTLRVALAQTSIPQDEKWVSTKIEAIYARLRELTEEAQADPATELVIWPETALPDDVRWSVRSYSLVKELAGNGTAILAGSLDTAETADGGKVYFNSAFLFDAGGRIAGEYAKRHLVVFGEYVPMEEWMPEGWKEAFGLPLSIEPGDGGAVFRAGAGRIPLSPLICFEDILPHLARADVRAGARMLVNVTNDAWFDEETAPMQHMRNALLRAVENRVPLVRAANTGISCAILPSGRVEALLVDGDGRTWEPGVLRAEVAAPPDEMPLTCYARFGDVYGIACAGATVLWVAGALRKRKREC